MSKHLIYLGYTGEAHRVALFDTDNILTKSVPVKDIQVLSADLEFLNCTVIDGKPVPNIQGAKILCTAEYTSEGTYRHYDLSKNLMLLQAFPNTTPEYMQKLADSGNPLAKFTMLHNYTYKFGFWDGTCTDKTLYALAEVGIPSKGKTIMTENLLCMTSEGDLLFLTRKSAGVLYKAGAVLVQAGTNDITVDNLSELCNRVSAVVGIPEKNLPDVYWVGRRGKVTKDLLNTASFIWSGGGKATTVLDLRKYKKAKVFGVGSCSKDASVVILPETAEVVWLGMFYECSSLKAVYLPKTLEKLIALGLPPRRFIGVTIYSASPIVKEFCESNNYSYIHCENADDALADFYKAEGTEYIDLVDASAIAGLTTDTSDKVGASGTVWSAVRFSCADKGMAIEEMQRRYPIIKHCDLSAPIIKNTQAVTYLGSLGDQGEYSKERVRLTVAGFTQFYPYTDVLPEEGSEEKTYVIPLGEYNLIVLMDVLVLDKLPPGDKEYRRDRYINHHITMLQEVSTGRIIHRFVSNEVLSLLLGNLYGACLTNQIPSAVLRYSDKIPSTSSRLDYSNKDPDSRAFAQELFKSFLPLMYGVKGAKLRLLGVDLYTGDLISMDTTSSYIRGAYKRQVQEVSVSLEGVGSVRRIQRYKENDTLEHLLSASCAYIKGLHKEE